MRIPLARFIAFTGALFLLSTVPALALEPIDDRVHDLLRMAQSGSMQDAYADVTPPERFDGLDLRERLVGRAAMHVVVGLVELGDRSPIRTTVSSGTFQRLVQELPRLKEADGVMASSLHRSTLATVEAGDLTQERVQLGLANLSLRELDEADPDDLVGQSIAVYTALAMTHVACQETLRQRLLALAQDTSRPLEIRQKAAELFTLGASTQARVQVAESSLRERLSH